MLMSTRSARKTTLCLFGLIVAGSVLTSLAAVVAKDQAAPPATVSQQPANGESVAPQKKGKKRQADASAEPGQAAEAAAKQALQSLFGN